MHNEPELTTLI